jgi:hypothetical protein
MTFPLIGLHAWLGEFAALMFVWAFIELYSGAVSNISRAKLAGQGCAYQCAIGRHRDLRFLPAFIL